MKTDKLVIVENWEQRHEAETLGMAMPEAIKRTTKFLFWKEDVKRANINEEGNIVLVMKDNDCMEVEYDDKMWKELERYFIKEEKRRDLE